MKKKLLLLSVFCVATMTSCNENQTGKADANTDTAIAVDGSTPQTNLRKNDSLEFKACEMPEYGRVDTAHDITIDDYNDWQRIYTQNVPAPKKIALHSLKDTFKNECTGKYIMFTFSAGNLYNTDINFKLVSQHHPDSSCYSVALFRRLEQKCGLADTDTIEFVKARRKPDENVRVLFKITKNQNSYFYDISENPKK